MRSRIKLCGVVMVLLLQSCGPISHSVHKGIDYLNSDQPLIGAAEGMVAQVTVENSYLSKDKQFEEYFVEENRVAVAVLRLGQQPAWEQFLTERKMPVDLRQKPDILSVNLSTVTELDLTDEEIGSQLQDRNFQLDLIFDYGRSAWFIQVNENVSAEDFELVKAHLRDIVLLVI